MKLIIAFIKKINAFYARQMKSRRLRKYVSNNCIPWSVGYEDFKWDRINEVILNVGQLRDFKEGKKLPEKYGVGIDERIIEYPFVFSRLSAVPARLLDAGSTFNFPTIVTHPALAQKDLTIFTACPEHWNFTNKKISYQFGDLRNLPYRNEWFDEIVCISTLEHVGMDNSIYGYAEVNRESGNTENAEYLKAIEELARVLKSGGLLMITFPFGVKKNYGYFQQFDSEMLNKVRVRLESIGKTETSFFRYRSCGWDLSSEEDCRLAEAYNPHSGEGKGEDNAAHSRAICGIQFIKK